MTSEPVLLRATPDANYTMTERIEWLTDVKYASDGTEQRIQVRRLPWFFYQWRSTLAEETGWPYYEQLLELARTASFVRIPLWPHAIPRTSGIPHTSRGVGLHNYLTYLALIGGTHEMVEADMLHSVPAGTSAIAPFGVGHLELVRSIEHLTPKVHQFDVRVRLTAHPEYAANPDTLETAAALASPPLSADWSVEIVEGSEASADVFTTDRSRLERIRYTKRSMKVAITVAPYGEITDLRRFLFACRGRLNAFWWKAPVDDEVKLWRLASDAVELEYLTPQLANTQLKLIQV